MTGPVGPTPLDAGGQTGHDAGHVVERESNCSDGIDNDNDGMTDCEDWNCSEQAACVCQTVTSLQGDASYNFQIGADDRHTLSCAYSDNSDVALEWTAPATGCYTFDVGDTDTTLGFFSDCPYTEELACANGGTRLSGISANATYFVVLEADSNTNIPLSVTRYCDNYDSDCTCHDVDENCTDGIDNDGDGYVDCRDSSCYSSSSCVETSCTDGVDNDNNGYTDCEDSDCNGNPACAEICDDGLDNDGDHYYDCEDTDCAYDSACQEICDDQVDNDGDGYIDCDDWGCDNDPACQGGGSDPVEGDLKLAFSNTDGLGGKLLLVYHNGDWGTICDDDWDTSNNAEVACKQITGSSATGSWTSPNHSGTTASGGNDPIWLDSLSCSGSESRLADCSHDPWGEHDCVHAEDVYLKCN